MTANSKINVQLFFKGMDSTDAIKDYAEKRADKFSKHVHEMTNCHFAFEQQKQNFIAQLRVTSGDFDAKAEARAETLYAAIDEVTDKLLQQSRKFKEKQTDHSGPPHHNQSNQSPEE